HSLVQFVGFNRLGLKNNKIIKPNTSYLEFNAIAKGYGIDLIGEFLESKGVDNYLVDIGAHLRVSGIKQERQ
ncbi:FAD:protein FMN transferase, partial [Maribacter flavus]